MAFSTNITSNEVIDGIYDDLDHYYLLLSSSKNSIIIEIPQFSWDRCDFTTSLVDFKFMRMYYGRYRNCGRYRCLSGYDKIEKQNYNYENKSYEEDETLIHCRKKTCEDGLILHVAKSDFKGFVDKQFPEFNLNDSENHWKSKDGRTSFTRVGKNLRMRSRLDTLYCLERYELKENERGVANDNGCWRGFNLDHSGICRGCGYVEFAGTDVGFYPSDCLLWLQLGKTSEDTLTYSRYHYNKGLLNKKVYYKGFKGDELYYRKIFYEEKSEEGKVTREIHDHIGQFGQYILRESESDLILKRCYSLSYNQGKSPQYELKALYGYTLSFISKDPTGQASSQIGIFGKNTPLNTFYCRKTCLQGYYYDFNSISCRRCNYGCAVCKKFEECDLCQPGFSKVRKPVYPIHKVDDEMVGQCQIGCQNGFYSRAFDGECSECDGSCLRCIDSLFVFKEKYDQKKNNPSFCLDCLQDSKQSALKKIINLSTGLCQSGCDQKVSDGSVIKENTSEFCHSCGRGCDDCEIPDTSNCLSCTGEFYFQNETKKCLPLTESTNLRIYLVVGLALTLLLLFSLGLLFLFYRNKKEKFNEGKRKTKIYLANVRKWNKSFEQKLARDEAAGKIGNELRNNLKQKNAGKRTKGEDEDSQGLTRKRGKMETILSKRAKTRKNQIDEQKSNKVDQIRKFSSRDAQIRLNSSQNGMKILRSQNLHSYSFLIERDLATEQKRFFLKTTNRATEEKVAFFQLKSFIGNQPVYRGLWSRGQHSNS